MHSYFQRIQVVTSHKWQHRATNPALIGDKQPTGKHTRVLALKRSKQGSETFVRGLTTDGNINLR